MQRSEIRGQRHQRLRIPDYAALHPGYASTAMEIAIRRATAADAEAVHTIVLLALRETNARDYPSSVIERLVLTLPDKVASNLETWCAFVAIVNERVVGTGSLNGQTVTSVYVHPELSRPRYRHKAHGRGRKRREYAIAADVERAIIGHGKGVLRKARLQDCSGRVVRRRADHPDVERYSDVCVARRADPPIGG
jgi:hypothetical protein